jgi:hypothetical protein
MKILQVALGNQFDIRDALSLHGDVVYWDFTKDRINFDHGLRSLVNEHNPDLVFMQLQTPGIISPWMAKELGQKTKIVNWTGDVRTPTPQWYIDIGRHIHLTLFTNMHDVEVCRKHGIKADYLQIGVPDKIFTPVGPVAKDVPDIVFFGNNPGGFPLSKMRADMVRSLKQRYGERFGYYGSGWGSDIRPINNQHEEASIYRGAKIAINLSHFDYPRYTSDRMLRAMGSGCMVLSKHYDGIEEEFDVSKHLSVWKDFSELFHHIDYFLTNGHERKSRALRGSEHVHANHTWRNRIEDLIKMV